MYSLFENELYPENNCIKKTDLEGNEYFIPFDEANTDYQEYLKWKAEQEG